MGSVREDWPAVRCLAVAASCVLALMLSDGASAATETIGRAGDLTYRVASGKLDQVAGGFQSGYVQPSCRNDAMALGGGPKIQGPPKKSYILESAQDGGGWESTVWQPKSVKSDRFSVIVVCENGATGIHGYDGFDGLAEGSNPGESPLCEGAHAAGGGVTWSPTPAAGGAYLNQSYPFDDPGDGDADPDDGWGFLIHGAASTDEQPFVQYTCRDGDPPVYRTKERELAAATSAKINAKCQANEHVMGGGSTVTGASEDTQIAGSYPVDLKDNGRVPDDAWRSVVASRGNASETVTAFAICDA